MSEIIVRPTAKGFIRKYVAAYTPFIVLVAGRTVLSYLNLPIGGIYCLLIIVLLLLIVMWVFRSREGAASSLITVMVFFIDIFREASTAYKYGGIEFVEEVNRWGDEAIRLMIITSFIAGTVVAIATELYRRSITYTIGEKEVLFEGGIIRRQKRAIPYHMIGQAILEQSILGRALNYGTVILVSPAAWGEELYIRGLGIGGGRGVGLGAGYARALQEISRDPLKVLYAIPNPQHIADIIREKITIPYEAHMVETWCVGKKIN